MITYSDIPAKLVDLGKANCRKGRHLSETQYYMESVASYEPIKIKKNEVTSYILTQLLTLRKEDIQTALQLIEIDPHAISKLKDK